MEFFFPALTSNSHLILAFDISEAVLFNTMSFQFDATNPNDLLNQRFRDHFSKQDSTLCNLLNVLEKPVGIMGWFTCFG